MPDLVSLEKVNKHFGDVHALRDVNLRVSAGDVGGPEDLVVAEGDRRAP